MGLNERQKEAVEYLDGPLLVLAGPGTGKTQLLSEKVAYILKNTDTNPENILCLTFTETGAANMRERLKTIVGRDGLKVNIGTYHAFGSEILAQYKNYSLDYERKLEAAIDEVTQFKIMKMLQGKLPGTDILRGDNVKDIISVISEAKAAGLTAKDLEIIAKQNMADAEVLSETISPLLKNVVPRAYKESYEGAYQPIYELIGKYAEGEYLIDFSAEEADLGPETGREEGSGPETSQKEAGLRSGAGGLRSETTGLGSEMDGLRSGMGQKTGVDTEAEVKNRRKATRSLKIERLIAGLARDLDTSIKKAEELEKIKPLSDWKDKYFEKDNRGGYRLKERVANKKLASLARIMEMYEEYLATNGLYDFDDMIREAVRVLREDVGFKMTLAERYQFIMLDEFQDTNPAQFTIVKELTDYEKPLIMAVGDDDQAIYEFQGALATNLTDFRDYYGAKVVSLVENYRSTQEILDFSREIIRQAPDRFMDKELFSHKEALNKSQIYRYEFLASDAEYSFIADKISELIKSGVSQNEIAVISYKRKYFEPLLPFLKAKPEIKIAYEKRDNLFEDEKMHEIFTLAKFIYEFTTKGNSAVQILEILAYEFFELPMLEVVKLVGRARAEHKAVFDCLVEATEPEILEVADFLAELIGMALVEPLEIVLDKIIRRMKIGKLSIYERFSFYENLASLKGKLAQHFGEKRLKTGDLVEFLADYEAAEMPLNTTSPYRDADEAVQILSAHKAKGLEFTYVFIISADHTAWGKGKGNNNLLALPKNLAQIRHTGTTDGEKLRILYVALTRAKEALFITNSLRDFNDKSPERLEYLNEYVEGEGVVSPFLPEKKVYCMYEAMALEYREANVKNWLTTFLKNDPDMRAIYRERVRNLRMSASALTTFIDIVYAGPEAFFRSYILQAPREPETEALAFGDLIHKTFEKVTKAKISDEEAISFYLEELEKKELSTDLIQKMREKGPADLLVSLKAFGEILRDGRAEVEFGADKLSIMGVPVTGKIDHILIDEENKKIEVYDFKTGEYHKEKWDAQATLYKYKLQLGFYKLLLNNSPRFSKYRVERAHILFVIPDKKDGEVYDKVYEYNKEDEEELVRLLRKVYELIESLEFLDDTEIFVTADSRLTLKDIKGFVEKILTK
ncbi:MAG: ATP-dependent DNA helicase [Candidatus Saccharibacteria bacterium]|nr:ATP-dependent DNA helicase [Candidatus Saccharibacteria bacterium]